MENFRLVRSPELSHADYADAAIVPAGGETVFFAGACPLDERGAVVGLGDVVAQTLAALEAMETALRACHVTRVDVVFVRVLVVADRPEVLGQAWDVVRAHFGERQPPATLQGVPVLGYPDQLVEIEPVAVRAAAVGAG